MSWRANEGVIQFRTEELEDGRVRVVCDWTANASGRATAELPDADSLGVLQTYETTTNGVTGISTYTVSLIDEADADASLGAMSGLTDNSKTLGGVNAPIPATGARGRRELQLVGPLQMQISSPANLIGRVVLYTVRRRRVMRLPL